MVAASSHQTVKLLSAVPPPHKWRCAPSWAWWITAGIGSMVTLQWTLDSAPEPSQWTESMTSAVRDLKTALTSAPAMGLPDNNTPLHLYVCESNGFTSGILVQKHVSHYRPVAFYSSRLPPVVQGTPACLPAVAATASSFCSTCCIAHFEHDCCM